MQTAQPRILTDLPLSQRDCEADGETHFLSIDEALRDTARGWSARQHIEARARMILGHMQRKNRMRAEELAVEIERLQIAEDARLGVHARPELEGREVWRIGLVPWASMIAYRGACQCRREFFPWPGATAEDALREARRVFHGLMLVPGDVEPVIAASRSARIMSRLQDLLFVVSVAAVGGLAIAVTTAPGFVAGIVGGV